MPHACNMQQTMAKKYRDEVNEFGLADNGNGNDTEYEEEEDHSLIELSSIEHRHAAASRPLGRGGGLGLASSSSSSLFGSNAGKRWIVFLFLMLLVSIYHLGLKEGKNEVMNERDGIEDGEKKHYFSSFVADDDDHDHETEESIEQTAPAAASKPKSKTGSFTLEHLHATRDEATKIVELLDNYYFGKDQAKRMLMDSWLATWDFDAPANETNTRDRAAKLVDTMARALVTDNQKSFLMGGIGSSVMAGHDNCHYDSYQSQMERLWEPVWKAAGMDFVFQNAGEGGGCGDSHQNQHFCVKQNISPDVDIVHYSWTYFEHGQGHYEHEDLVRWTQMLPKQPMVHLMYTGGPLVGSDHPYSQVTQHYSKYGLNSFFMFQGFFNGGHDYESEKSDPDNPFDRLGWGYVGDGYHNTTRYGEVEENDQRKHSLGIVMRNWHPGPMGFQITSDAFTYVYTHALLKALDLIEKDMSDSNDPRDTWSASKRKYLLKGDLPEPLYCDPEYCVVDEAPECLNYELPTFGKRGARVEDSDGELNPYAGEKQNWTLWHQDNDMWYMVPGDDRAYFQDREDKEICRHLDACGGIAAQLVDDGMVVFRLPKMEVGLVVICGFGADKFTNSTHVEISYNTVPLNQTEMDVFPNAKCVRVLKRFPTTGRESETPTGHAYLAVKVLNDMEEKITISHVITL